MAKGYSARRGFSNGAGQAAQQMQIDEIRVYDTPLSAEWIDEIEPLEGK